MAQRERITIEPGDAVTGVALVLGTALGTWGLWAGINRAPIEAELKLTQKIFYLHAPMGMWTITAAIVAAGAAIAYLWRRDGRADLLSAACMEFGMVGCGISLVTGCLWAKPAWGDWFPWGDPRVTLMLVLFLVTLAYRGVRSSVDEADRRARFAAVVAIMGAIVAGFAYAAILIWNTTHPRVITMGEVRLQADMKRAFYICIAAVGVLAFALVNARYRLLRLASRLDRLVVEAEERGVAAAGVA